MSSLIPAFHNALDNLLEMNSSLFEFWYQTLCTVHGDWIEDELTEYNLMRIETDVMKQMEVLE